MRIMEEQVTRVSPENMFDIFTGIDAHGRDVLVILSKEVPSKSIQKKMNSSKVISISLNVIQDGVYKVSAALEDSRYSDLFKAFVDDVITAAGRKKIKTKEISFFVSRYCAWKRMFSNVSDSKLTGSEIKGLVGELLFLKNFMLKHYSIQDACEAWIGVRGLDQDFQASDCWYEVKTTTSGNPTIRISSIEQLDALSDGYLCVLEIDQTSNIDPAAITLNMLVDDISEMICDSSFLDDFEEKLRIAGYRRMKEYDDYAFRLYSSRRFLVDINFPALRRVDINKSEIINASYDLDISNIVPIEKDFI